MQVVILFYFCDFQSITPFNFSQFQDFRVSYLNKHVLTHAHVDINLYGFVSPLLIGHQYYTLKN